MKLVEHPPPQQVSATHLGLLPLCDGDEWMGEIDIPVIPRLEFMMDIGDHSGHHHVA